MVSGMPRPGTLPRTAVRNHCAKRPLCILEDASSRTHAQAHVAALYVLVSPLVLRRWGDPAAAASSSDSRLCPSWGQQSTGHCYLPNLLPYLVPGKPPQLQQLPLHGGVKNPVLLQRRLRRFCAPAVPSCALGKHCRHSWLTKLAGAKEAEELVSKSSVSLGVPDHPGAERPVDTTTTCTCTPRGRRKRAPCRDALWAIKCFSNFDAIQYRTEISPTSHRAVAGYGDLRGEWQRIPQERRHEWKMGIVPCISPGNFPNLDISQ